MSDAAMIGNAPFRWEHKDAVYEFAATDLEVELMFQSLHEAWARARLEATKGRIGEEAWTMDHARHVENVSANQFAMGGRLSMMFLFTTAGFAEYATLKWQKQVAGKGPQKDKVNAPFLHALAKNNAADFESLRTGMLRHDFPNLFAPVEGATKPTGA